ncbi:hypothetical protein ACQ4PT_032575 [Festuca glaucescens]
MDCGDEQAKHKLSYKKVAEMRAVVQAQDPSSKEEDDFALRRFLRARDHNIGKASAMFLKYLAWKRAAKPRGSITEDEVRNELVQDKLYVQGFDIMQNYYPERLGRVLLIHVPYVFMAAWKMVYPFIDDTTKKKFVRVRRRPGPRRHAPGRYRRVPTARGVWREARAPGLLQFVAAAFVDKRLIDPFIF